MSCALPFTLLLNAFDVMCKVPKYILKRIDSMNKDMIRIADTRRKYMKKSIVFVCTGNTCRSPMAEALFKDIIKEKGGMDEFEVSSRGVYAFSGDPSSRQAIEVMKKEFGIDMQQHRAKVLDGSDIIGAYLVLTMTMHHKDMILDIYPEASDKIYTIKEYAQVEDDTEFDSDTDVEGDTDISDPFGGDYQTYKDCALEIEELLIEVLNRI